MIKAVNIIKSFDGRTVLNDVSVEFGTGQCNLIIGRSGSGKTVLLKSLVGLHDVDEGAIYYDDICYSTLDFRARKAIRKDVGMIFQGGALLDASTVAENVKLPLDLFTGQSEEEKMERVNYCLHRVNLDHAHNLYPSELSGGMVKRAAIARAIVMNPRYLFCDEPNSGLDPKTAQLIDELIKDITDEFKMTTIVVSHDMNSVINIGDKIIFLNEGIKEWEGSKSEVMDSKNEKVNDFVFASDLFKKIKVADDIITEDKKG